MRQSGEWKVAKLMDAVNMNNIERVRQLIKDAYFFGVTKKMIIIPNKDGQSPLWGASFLGYTNIVILLLDAGTEVIQSSNNGATPFHAASQENHGADVNKSNNDGSFPAYMAAKNGNIDVLNFLILRGTDVGKKLPEHYTTLHCSIQQPPFDS